MSDDIRNIKKTLRLRSDEAELLAKKAEKSGMNEAEYIRYVIAQNPRTYPEIRKLLNALINEVNQISVNIGQIVHNVNSDIYQEEDKTRLIAYMKKLCILVNEVMNTIGNNKDSEFK